MKSSRKNTFPGNPSFDYINRIFRPYLLFFHSVSGRIGRLLQSGAFSIPSRHFLRSVTVIRHNISRHSLNRAIRCAEFRLVRLTGAHVFLPPLSFGLPRISGGCIEGVSGGDMRFQMRVRQERCGAFSCCALQQRRVENGNGL